MTSVPSLPDGHAVGRQVEPVGAGQRVAVGGERVGQGRHRLVKQVGEDAMHRFPSRFWQILDL